MGLWDNPKPIGPELDALLTAALKANLPSPEELRKAWEAHLVTHCEHGHARTEHCPWCHVQTSAYKQALADGMWTILD
jgi:hypothetical protein